MYLVDYCYLGNALLFYYINFDPKNEWLFMACYCLSNGTLAAGVAAFRNSLVYHKIDYLTSLATHAVPMVLSVHIRWETIPRQADLPPEE